MNTNVNLDAAFGALALVGSCAALLLIGLIALRALLTKRRRRADGGEQSYVRSPKPQVIKLSFLTWGWGFGFWDL